MMTTSIRDLPVVVNTMIGLIKLKAWLLASSQGEAVWALL